MKERPKDDGGERRMLLPELASGTTPVQNCPPIHIELIPAQVCPPRGRTPPPTQNEPTNDVGSILAPGALAALRAALAGKKTYVSSSGSKSDPPSHVFDRRMDPRMPVLKTSTGSFVVTPQVSLSFPSRPSLSQRSVSSTIPPALGFPSDHVLFKKPDLHINLQPQPRPPSLPTLSKSPVSTYLVHSGGQYLIVSGGDMPRSEMSRPFLDIGMKPILSMPHPVVDNKASILMPSIQPSSILRPSKMTLTPKLQSTPPKSQSLFQNLTERKPPCLSEPLTSGSFEEKAESLKSLFISGGMPLPATPIEELNIGIIPKPEYLPMDRGGDNAPKRRKTRPNPVDDKPRSLSPVHQAGLNLLLQAAKKLGDTLPRDVDLPRKRSTRGRKSIEDRSLLSRMAYCADPLLRQNISVLHSFTGVYPLQNGEFIARCRFKGCYVRIGTFKLAEDAARAYDRVVLSIRGRKADTNFPFSEYLPFELSNSKRAFEAKYRQCESIRRGSTWPWARAAQTLLSKDEEVSEDGVPERGTTLGPFKEDVSGKCVFELLQNVMLEKKDLNGTFDLIQSRIRNLKIRIQSGLSTEEECDCVGQYACVASILGNMVSMQNEWERKHRFGEATSAAVLLQQPILLSEPVSSESKPVGGCSLSLSKPFL